MNPRLLAAAILAGMLVSGCHHFVSAGNSNAITVFNSSDAVKRTVKASSPVSSATRLKVHESFGSITTTSREGNSVDVTAEVSANGKQSKDVLKSWLEKANVAVTLKDGIINVELQKPAGLPKDISIYASYDIKLPATLEQELHSDNGAVNVIGPSRAVDAGTSFGSISVNDVQGGVKAHSSNGSVTVKKVRGDVDARSSFGEVRTESIQGRVVAHSDNGAVGATDIEGDLEASSNFGEIRIANIRGAVTAKSQNGAVTAKEVHAGTKDVSLTSSFGEVRFAGEAGGLTTHSDNGSQTAELSTMPRQTTITGSFGDIKLIVPGNASAEVQADTDFGSVHLENLPLKLNVDAKNHWAATLGKGGAKIKMNTKNGSITLKGR